MIIRNSAGADVQVRDANLGALIQASGGQLRGSSSVAVTGKSVGGVPAANAAIRVAAEAVSRRQLRVWRGEGVSRTEVRATWQARFFQGLPNDQEDWPQLLEQTEASLTARWNAYWHKLPDERAGQIAAVELIHPDNVEPRWNREQRRPEYRLWLNDTDRWSDWLGRDEVLHFRVGFPAPGSICAPSPVEWFRDQLAAVLSKQRYEKNHYERGLMQSLAVIFGERVDHEQAEKWRRGFQGENGGLDNSAKVRTFGGGVTDVKTIGLSLTDAQWIESMNFSVEEIARMLGVVPSLIGAAMGGGVKQLISPEHEERRWNTYGLEPRLLRIQGTIRADPSFFGHAAKDYPMFVPAPVRGDINVEAERIKGLVQSGVITPDEGRAELGYAPLPDGLGQILQITPVGGAENPDLPAPPAAPEAVDDDEGRTLRLDLRMQREQINLDLPAPVVNVDVHVPEQATPVVNVHPELHGPDVAVTVEPAPVTVEAPVVHVEAPAVEVHVPTQPAPTVQVDLHQPERKLTLERNGQGQIKGATIEDV